MNRIFLPFHRSFLLCLIVLPAFCLDAKSDKPNIVFILADDLGVHQVGCYGSDFYETPIIDQLAQQGMKFTNAYAACTVCSPTRASIMTGKYPARLHLTNFIPGKNRHDRKLLSPDWTAHLALEEVTIAETLKQAGYATGHFGKWHLNTDKKYAAHRPGDPGSQGFDDVLATHKPRAGPASPYDEDWHHVQQITVRATRFIEHHKQAPFFCYVSHNSIHAPEIESESLIAKYATKPSSKAPGNNPKQAAMLETLDKSIGAILEKLKQLGLEENTIVVFFSDNGHLGPKQGKPFRGSKGDLYEGGIRMPLVIRWPLVVPGGTICEEIVISNDFFPTLNEVAEMPNANVPNAGKDRDGLSLLPLLKDPQAKLDREAIYWHFPHYHITGLGPQGAIRKGRYKLIEWFEKSVDGETGAFELYDLIDDPAEKHSLTNTLPNVVIELSNDLESWRKQAGAQRMSRRKNHRSK